MKSQLTFFLLTLSIPLIAGASHISLGDQEYPVLFEDAGEPAEFRNLVAEDIERIFAPLLLTNPFPPSRLDVSKIDVVGVERWVVPTKSTVIEPQGVSASFFLWIFDGGHWKVFFPSSLEGLGP